jgi:acetyl esterase/lipase
LWENFSKETFFGDFRIQFAVLRCEWLRMSLIGRFAAFLRLFKNFVVSVLSIALGVTSFAPRTKGFGSVGPSTPVHYKPLFNSPLGSAQSSLSRFSGRDRSFPIQSLESWFMAGIKFVTRYAPLDGMRLSMSLLRWVFIKSLLDKDQRFCVEKVEMESCSLDVINFESSATFYRPSGPPSPSKLYPVTDTFDVETEEIILYLHGGGFVLNDCSDILLCDRLLPELHTVFKENALGDSPMKPRLYVLNYELARQSTCQTKSSVKNQGPCFERVHKQVLDAYDELEASGRRVKCVIGNSAGGNLALGLVLALQHRNKRSGFTTQVPPVVLVSPWLDLFSNDREQVSVRNDYLSYTFLDRCREAYLGPSVNSIAELKARRKKSAELADKVVESGVKVVCFDMDQCMVAQHSMGSLLHRNVEKYISKTSPDFPEFAMALAARGIKLAVATHSDAAEHSFLRPKRFFCLGEMLARAVLRATVPDIANDFFVVAYNPVSRRNKRNCDAAKKLHIRHIARKFGSDPSECILFDDDPTNCRDTDGLFSAYRVDAKRGFQLDDALLAISDVSPMCMAHSSSRGSGDGGHHVRATPAAGCNHQDSESMDVEVLLSPLKASEEQLRSLPQCLVVCGEQELLYYDIMKFVDRVKDSQRTLPRTTPRHLNSPSAMEESRERDECSTPLDDCASTSSLADDVVISEIANIDLVVGDSDIHSFPLFHRHPLKRLFSILKCSWLYELICRERTMVCAKEIEIQGEESVADSKQAREAIQSIALFVAETVMFGDSGQMKEPVATAYYIN